MNATLQRNYKYDNLKAILIFLVIFGHIISVYNPSMFFVYTFHMPAFIYVSGRFTKPDAKRMAKFLFIYFIFQALYSILYYEPLNFITPVKGIWYMMTMMYYTALAFVMPETVSPKRRNGLIISSVIVAILIGFVPFVGRVFSLSRTIVFLPFFIAGKYRLFDECDNHKRRIVLPSLAVCVLLAICYVLALRSYLPLTQTEPYENPVIGPMVRILSLVIAFCMIYLLLTVIPNKKIPVITDAGKRTLFIYLFHCFFTEFVKRHLKPWRDSFVLTIFASIVIFLGLWLAARAVSKTRTALRAKRMANADVLPNCMKPSKQKKENIFDKKKEGTV